MKKLKVLWDKPYIDKEGIFDIQPSDLDDFFASASQEDRFNLFFVLLHSLHRCEESGEKASAARMSFLIAYYLFVPLTPPASHELALNYIRHAVSLSPCDEYRKWLLLIEKGN